MSATTILDKAAQVWVASRTDYRDAMLRVGRLLHEYVLARLNEGARRMHATREVAERLKIRVLQVNMLMCAEKAVELLGAGDAGELPWSGIKEFRITVQRDREKRGRRDRSPGQESWVVVVPEAAELFRRAASEGWDVLKIRHAVRTICGKQTKDYSAPHGYQGKAGAGPASDLLIVAKVGTARDLTDLLLQAARSANDPLAVVELLRAGLPELERAARRDMLTV